MNRDQNDPIENSDELPDLDDVDSEFDADPNHVLLAPLQNKLYEDLQIDMRKAKESL